jgi:DNA-binding transcriptional LysR family regulator
MRSETVYMERYCLLVQAAHPLADAASVSWADAAREPLCLLTSDNQNRRIIDRAFRAAGTAPVPRLETNSVVNLCANVRLGGLVSVIPEYFLEVLGPIADVRPVPLTSPMIEHSVGLIAVDRDPVSPLVLAAFECARNIEPPPVSRP